MAKRNVARKNGAKTTPLAAKVAPVAPAKVEEVKADVKEAETKKEEPMKAAVPANTEETVAAKEVVKAAETVKAEPKKRGRKPAAEKAEAAPKKPAKKAAEKEAVEEVIVQFDEGEFFTSSLVERVKEEWKNEGHRIGSIKTLRIYVNIKERRAYYVINDKAEDKFVSF